MNYWPGKDTFLNKKASVEDSKDKDEDSYDPNAMEAYLKKQQQQQKSPAVTSKKPVVAVESESSDRYDEDDFESLSKSQTALTGSMLQQPPPA